MVLQVEIDRFLDFAAAVEQAAASWVQPTCQKATDEVNRVQQYAVKRSAVTFICQGAGPADLPLSGMIAMNKVASGSCIRDVSWLDCLRIQVAAEQGLHAAKQVAASACQHNPHQLPLYPVTHCCVVYHVCPTLLSLSCNRLVSQTKPF